MKRVFYLYAIFLGAIVCSCNPMDDLHDEARENAVGVVESIELTLTDDDYDELDLQYGSFNSEDEARELLPPYLAELYPYLDTGSSVNVFYNLYIGNAEGVSDFTGADEYELTIADYAASGSDAFGYYPNVDATSKVISVLENQIEAPTEGQIVLARYRQYFEDPEVGFASLFEYNFNGSLDGFENISVAGDGQVWEPASFGGVEYAYMSGYDGGSIVNEDWLISPEMDLSGETDIRVQIRQAINYADDVSLLSVLVSSNYTTGGDVMAATWELIDFADAPAGNNWDFILSEDYDLSAYDGETIHIALKYESTADDAASWEVDQLLVKALGVSGEYNSKGEFFMYSGDEWTPMEGVYFLSSADFDAMGEGEGQPGENNTFGSSIPPNNYLPTFMSINFPYGQEEEQLFVIYDYSSSSSGPQLRGNLYTVIDGVWTGHESTVESSLQFGFDGTEWVPDNTIQYTLTGADYDYIATTYASEPGFEAAAGNLANYGNFNRTGGGTSWSDDMMFTVLTDLMANVVDPTAEEGQKYVLSYDVYNGSNAVETMSLIKEGGEWILNE
ncbi:choice-of-anchor J domain-containing protein [Mangrovimonas sp. DI 80]|uniref:choice-of-anchor J domain-containing protein n=1 Tax=Mangrovimonas sp. DI 80 TaxID=1779330 RepID=UPI000977E5BA|nr:choice-of-anchor J domain-containing protein [Mangrovimonas sp. DI 80]OMP32548.1 hypothetical protein BKM32_05755 [Mangrovimonas sp. DI 80]